MDKRAFETTVELLNHRIGIAASPFNMAIAAITLMEGVSEATLYV